MAIEKVREYLKQWGIEDKIMEFDVSSATVELAAQALHCEPKSTLMQTPGLMSARPGRKRCNTKA